MIESAKTASPEQRRRASAFGALDRSHRPTASYLGRLVRDALRRGVPREGAMAKADDPFLAWLAELSGPLSAHQNRLVVGALRLP